MADSLRKVREWHRDLPAPATMEPVLVVGLPVSRILEIAEKRGACQIVMGSRGRTGLPGLLLGSKELTVAQLAPIPVNVVRRHSEKE